MTRSLRLPPEIEADIKKLAGLNERSENAEIIVALKKYIREQIRCSYNGCHNLAEIECNIGECAPSTWYCSACYEQKHIPDEDERQDNA
jgi:hypothetical protein